MYKPSCIFLITHLKRKDFIHPNVLDLPIDEEHPARSAHDCRRTYASLEYLNGTDIFTLSKKPRSIDFTMFLGFRQEHETAQDVRGTSALRRPERSGDLEPSSPGGARKHKKDILPDVFLCFYRARDGTRTREVFPMKPATPNKIKEKRICASGFNRFWTHFGRICVQNCIFNIPSTFKIQIVIK